MKIKSIAEQLLEIAKANDSTIDEAVIIGIARVNGIQDDKAGKEALAKIMDQLETVDVTINPIEDDSFDKACKYISDIADISTSSYQMYMHDVRTLPMLTAEEELELGKRAHAGDRDAINELVVRNLRLGAFMAKRYLYQYGDSGYMDAIQNATLGLFRAAEKFDPAMGRKFSTYASYWIRCFVLRGWQNEEQSIRIPVHVSDKATKINAYVDEYTREHGCSPSAEQLGEKFDLLADVAASYLASRSVDSIDRTITNYEGDVTPLGELVESFVNTESEAMLSFRLSDISKALKAKLSERDYFVVMARFGLLNDDKDWTLKEIADETGLTTERVRQISKDKLRKLASDSYIRDLLYDWFLDI